MDSAVSYPLWFGGDGTSGDQRRPVVSLRTPAAGAQSGTPLSDVDQALVARIRAGDVLAFEHVFQDMYPSLVRFVQIYGVTEDEADDIVVDVFAALWDGRATWSPARSAAAYVFRAARNRALNIRRDMHTMSRYVSAAAREMEAPLMGERPPSPDREFEDTERTTSLWDAIATLPERQRVLLVLRWRDTLSIEEIAAVMGLSLGATKTALTRAAQALRHVLPNDFF